MPKKKTMLHSAETSLCGLDYRWMQTTTLQLSSQKKSEIFQFWIPNLESESS